MFRLIAVVVLLIVSLIADIINVAIDEVGKGEWMR